MLNFTLAIKKNKNYVLIALALIALFALDKAFHQKISVFLTKKISKEIENRELDIKFSTADYGYFPPRVIINSVFYDSEQLILNAEFLSLSANIIPLIKAKFVPNTLYIKSANVKIKSKKEDSLNTKNLSTSFEKIYNLIPLNAIQLENSSLEIGFKDGQIDLKNTDLEVLKKTRSIDFLIQSKSTIEHPKHHDSFDINISSTLDKDSIYLRFANLQKKNSIVNLSGSIKSNILSEISDVDLKLKSMYSYVNELRMNATIDLADVSQLIKILSKKKTESNGLLLITSYFNEYSKNDKNSINLVAKKINTPFIELKEAKIEADIFTEKIVIGPSIIKLTDSSQLQSSGAVLKKENETYWLKTSLDSKNINFEDILSSLKAGKLDIKAPIKIKTDCTGSIYPVFGVTCKGQTAIKSLNLNINGKTFLDLNTIKSAFTTKITKKELFFSSKINSTSDSSSYAKAEGSIHYVKGFDINFESESFNLNFINVFAGQKLKGTLSGTGQTKGSSKWGTVAIDISEANNFKFNEFYFGNVKGDLSYKFPYFKVSNISGGITLFDSYSGDFMINTQKDSLSLALKGSNANDSSIRLLFRDLFEFPESITFTKLEYDIGLSGPLDIEKTNLDIKTQFKSIDFYEESFQSAAINLSGTEGEWKFSDTNFLKKSSSVTASGSVKGFKTIDIELKSKALKLEDIDKLKALNFKLTGDADFQLKAQGPIGGPVARGQLLLTNTLGVNRENLGSSNLNFRLYEDQISFEGETFKKAIVGQGVYPLNADGVLEFTGQVKNLDILSLTEFNSDAVTLFHLPVSFKSSVRIDFLENKINTSGWIENFVMVLKNVNEPVIKLSKFERANLKKDKVDFKLKSKDGRQTNVAFDFSQKKGIGIDLNGSVNASPLIAFIPSTEIIEGDIEFKRVSLFFTQDSLDQSGSILYSNGIFKTNDFPYSFSDFNATLLLTRTKVLFKEIQTRLNNSIINGTGYLNTSPLNLNLSVKFDDLRLAYPEGINSLSSGEITVIGSQLPLQTKGLINVSEGQFTKDLLTTSDGKTVSVNRFLPKQVLYHNAPPFDLNLLLKISETFKVKSSEITGNVKGALRLKGNAYNPNSVGSLELIKNMEISFLDKIFKVQEGRVSYENFAIDNPSIYVDATSDVFDSNDIQNKKYNVRMLVKGRAQDPKISFTSQPPLGEKEIISLLTLGTVSTQTVGQEINTQQQATYSGLQVGSFLIQKNKAIRELQEKTGTEIGISSSVDALSVNPKVQLKKKWSPKLSSTVSQSFGNQQVLSLSTEYNVNEKVSTSINVRNNQTQDASQLINRRVQQGEIFGVDLQYKFEFE